MITIVFGKPEDIDLWMQLVVSMRDSFPGLETEEAIAEHKEAVLKLMENHEAICAKEEGRIVGALLFLKDNNELCYLAVAPDYRRQHIADQLFELMCQHIDLSKPIGVSTYRKGDPKGKAAIAFYEKHHFKAGDLIEEFDYPCQRYTYR